MTPELPSNRDLLTYGSPLAFSSALHDYYWRARGHIRSDGERKLKKLANPECLLPNRDGLPPK